VGLTLRGQPAQSSTGKSPSRLLDIASNEKHISSLPTSPITSTSPAGNYWGIDQHIEYGTDTMILSTTAGIVDTGTTLILIATDAYEKYVSATGAVFDSTVGLLSVTQEQYDNMKSLFFVVGGVS